MIRRSYLIFTLIAALGVGAAFAQTAGQQKEKQKEKANKDRSELEYKQKAGAQPFASLPMMIGDGSYLGVFLEEVTPERVKELGLAEERGAIVMKVVEGSPAQKSGLKENDVIVSFNSRRVDSVRELQRLMSETPAGREVPVEIVRGTSKQTLRATLTRRSLTTSLYGTGVPFNEPNWQQSEEAMKRAEELLKRYPESVDKLGKKFKNFGDYNFVNPGKLQSFFFRGARLGINAETLTEQLADYFGVKEGRGLLITEVHENTPAAKAGLKAGDVIIAIDNEKIDKMDSLINGLRKKEEGTITLKVIRNRNEQTITVNLEKREPGAPPRRGSTSVARFNGTV